MSSSNGFSGRSRRSPDVQAGPALLLPRSASHRTGDQREPALAVSNWGPGGAVVAAGHVSDCFHVDSRDRLSCVAESCQYERRLQTQENAPSRWARPTRAVPRSLHARTRCAAWSKGRCTVVHLAVHTANPENRGTPWTRRSRMSISRAQLLLVQVAPGDWPRRRKP